MACIAFVFDVIPSYGGLQGYGACWEEGEFPDSQVSHGSICGFGCSWMRMATRMSYEIRMLLWFGLHWR